MKPGELRYSEPIAQAFVTLGRIERAGLKLRAWRFDDDQRAELKRLTGQDRILLGYPVKHR